VHPHLDIFKNSHGFKQPDILKSSGDASGDNTIASQVIKLSAIVSNRSVAWWIDTCNHVENSCFASSVRTYKT